MSIRFAFLLLEEHPWGREMLRVLLANGYEPELVVQEVSELAGIEREKHLARMAGQCHAPRIAEQVRERVIPVWYVSSHNNDFCGELLAAEPPDLLVLGGTRMIRETWALYKDLPQGATVHFVDTHMDEADIILCRELPVYRGDTYEKLNGRMATLAGELMAETLGYFERGAVPRTPQDRAAGETMPVIPEDLLAEGKRRLIDETYSHFAPA
jgi:hypothetical protein